MTLESTTNRVDVRCNGVAKVFNVPFYFVDASHLTVILTERSSGVPSPLALGTDYSVSGAGNPSGGSVTTVATYSDAYELAIIRSVPFKQLTKYTMYDAFPALSHERALDLLTMQTQQLAERADRAFTLPENVTGADPATPPPEAGYVLGWNAAGTRLVNLVAGEGSGAQLQVDLANTATGKGAALVGAVSSFGGVERNQAQKNQDTVTTSDFSSLASAVTKIGSAPVTLYVNNDCTVSSDLSIPANIHLSVRSEGTITVGSGVRLTINGHFEAPRRTVFSSTVHTCAFTGSVNGSELTVTAVSSGKLERGQVLHGVSGAPAGTTIGSNGTGSGGTGTYYLNNPIGIVSSQSMTATGPSVSFAPGSVSKVYPQWFGAMADDGTTDNAAAFQQAAFSINWGGIFWIPAGKYMVNSTTVLHGGMTVEGEGSSDKWHGAPPNVSSIPSFIWLGANNTSIFTIPSSQSQVHIRMLAMSGKSTPTDSPSGTAKWGIQFEGHYPGFIWEGLIEQCSFFDLNRSISVNDSWAGNATYWDGSANVTYYDWAVNPVTVRNCSFWYSGVGLYFNTNNADAWNIKDCTFFIPSGGSGARLVRCGYIKFDNCFSGGAAVSYNNFLGIYAVGAGSLDTIVLDNCQAETLTHFIRFDASSTNTTATKILVRNSIHQMGADVYLGKMCDYVSENNQILSVVYVDATGVTVHSILDNFGSGFHISKLSGDAGYLKTYVPGAVPDTTLLGGDGTALAGRVTTYGTAAPASGAWNAGDRCVRKPPVVGSPKAWSCTVAGSPGTWVSEGDL